MISAHMSAVVQKILFFLSRSVDRLAMSPYHAMLDAIEHGYTWPEYVRRGCIPIQLIRQYRTAWNVLQGAANLSEWEGRSAKG